MIRWRHAVPVFLTASTVTLSACGADQGTATDASQAVSPSAPATSSAAAPSTPAATSRPAPPEPPYEPLDGVEAGVPNDWKTGSFNGLSFAVPAAAGERPGITEPNRDGYVERAWNGAPIRGTTAPDGNGEALAEYLIQSSTTAAFDGAVPVGGARVFALTVPGAEVAAGSLDEEPVPGPGSGTVLRLRVYIQGPDDANYQAGMTTSDNSTGEQMVRQFIGALSLG